MSGAGAGAGAAGTAGTATATEPSNSILVIGVAGDKAFEDLSLAARGLAALSPFLAVEVKPVADAAAFAKTLEGDYVGASVDTTAAAVINGKKVMSSTDAVGFLQEYYVGHGRKRTAVFHDNDPEGEEEYDYEVAIIGGGSGGLAAAKTVADTYKKKVLLCDWVRPSVQGTKWGLGGTCVNVGCIPKKLFHTAALLGASIKDSTSYGWSNAETAEHNWMSLRDKVHDYIRELNFSYRIEMRESGVTYQNVLASFKGPHELNLVNRRKKTSTATARRIIIAVGGRPTPLPCPGGDLAITSDDIFQLDHAPGKTLVVGASYVALECAGFLTGFGFDTTVMVRSILLRGFDQQCAELIGEHMAAEGTKFIRPATPTNIVQTADGKLQVTFTTKDGEQTEIYDTVVAAIGRKPETGTLNLDAAGVKTASNGKIKSDTNNEQTNVPHIYAVGDVLYGKPELTPSAIQASKLLVHRLLGGATQAMDYELIPTAVFTPIEYGCCGLSEEAAIERVGADNVEVFHNKFVPLEWAITGRSGTKGYLKLVCDMTDDLRVLGLHYLGPNAGEVTQGFGTALRLGATYHNVFDTVGIHPTTAEKFTTLSVTKRSGEDIEAGGGC